MSKFLSAPARGQGLSKPKTKGPKPLWQPPTINARNGNVINGFFYAVINGRRKSLRTTDEAIAWQHLQALTANNPEAADDDPTVGALVNYRLQQVKEKASFRPVAEALFDFVTGHQVTFVDDKLEKGRRIHNGYGHYRVSELKGYHVEKWLSDHPKWNRSTRSNRVSLIRSVFNQAKKLGLIKDSPIREYSVPGVTRRESYFDPETEQLIYQAAGKSFGEFLWLCINTGMRPYSEAAKMTADHVQINDKGQMRINFGLKHKTGEKTQKPRIVYPSPAVQEEILKRMELRPRGSGVPLWPWNLGEERVEVTIKR